MGRRTRSQKETPQPEPVTQVPARGCDVSVRAISLDYLLVQCVSESGMNVSAYTWGYDQVRNIVDGVQAWLELERPVTEEVPEVNPIARLVGPTGETLVK